MRACNVELSEFEAVMGKSQIKYQIPKQQKGFSKHVSILLVSGQW